MSDLATALVETDRALEELAREEQAAAKAKAARLAERQAQCAVWLERIEVVKADVDAIWNAAQPTIAKAEPFLSDLRRRIEHQTITSGMALMHYQDAAALVAEFKGYPPTLSKTRDAMYAEVYGVPPKVPEVIDLCSDDPLRRPKYVVNLEWSDSAFRAFLGRLEGYWYCMNGAPTRMRLIIEALSKHITWLQRRAGSAGGRVVLIPSLPEQHPRRQTHASPYGPIYRDWLRGSER